MIARYTLSASGAPRTCVKSLWHNNFADSEARCAYLYEKCALATRPGYRRSADPTDIAYLNLTTNEERAALMDKEACRIVGVKMNEKIGMHFVLHPALQSPIAARSPPIALMDEPWRERVGHCQREMRALTRSGSTSTVAAAETDGSTAGETPTT
jgi:hypothetical protein